MSIRLVWTIAPELGIGATCHGSWSGSFFGVGIIISYLVLFTRLYNEKYHQDQQSARRMAHQDKMKSAARGDETGAHLPPHEFSSTFSPLCKTAPPTGTSASAALGAVPVLANLEDAYAQLRDEWLMHPMIVADRERWAAHDRSQPTSAASAMESHREGVAAERDSPRKSDATLHRRLAPSSNLSRL